MAGPQMSANSHNRTYSDPQEVQNRLYENPLESVQISLGILRISGSPQKGTEKGSFPYIPVRALSWGPAPIGRRTQRVPEHCGIVGRVEVA